MRATTRLGAALVLVTALVAALLASGCDSDPESDLSVEEGLPVRLGDLLYNVAITRFLNPGDPEDKAYLAGQPPPANDEQYLGVFMLIENESDESQTLPTEFKVVDTDETEIEPLPSDSLFALDLGARVGPDGEVPEPETTAANGPIQGSMVLFRVTETIAENRPLTLEIPSESGEVAEVELDL
jgi:hypothetical protein